jgi:prepilin-type N-terminal cleavage/methylation domain-containing protein
MILRGLHLRKSAGRNSGFTLAEVVTSMAVLGVVVQGVILGYVASAQRAEWSAHSLAAQSIATQGAEQARAAKWDPQGWPQGVGPGQCDELGVTSYVQTNQLDIAGTGKAVFATNVISITTISANPPVRQIRSDCVWRFMNHGLFTNSVILLRAPDQ